MKKKQTKKVQKSASPRARKLITALRREFKENGDLFTEEDEAEHYEDQGYDDTGAHLQAGGPEAKKRLQKFLKKIEGIKHSSAGYRIYRAVNVSSAEAFIQALKSQKESPRHAPDCDGGSEVFGCDCPRGLGVYWSFKRKLARPYWGQEGETVVITADVALDGIDLIETIKANIYGEHSGGEDEITLKEGAVVTLVQAQSEMGGTEDLEVEASC